MRDILVGVLGGMGPEATAEVYRRIIKWTPAKVDQEHIRTLIYSNPKIPDRNAAILYDSESPLPALIKSARLLAGAGVDFIVIPCNGAHYFYEPLQAETPVPILHMVRETANEVVNQYPDVVRVGLLAATCTLSGGVYSSAFAGSRVELLVPEAREQEDLVMAGIYGVKAGRPWAEMNDLQRKAAAHLIDRGAQLLIAGCTEVSVGLRPEDVSVPLVDPEDVIARLIVQKASLPVEAV